MNRQKYNLSFITVPVITLPLLVIVYALLHRWRLNLFDKMIVGMASALIILLIFIIVKTIQTFHQMNRRQKTKIFLVVSILLIPIYVLIYPLLPPRILYRKEIKVCEEIIKTVETYRDIHGHFPEQNDWKTLNVRPNLFDESSPYKYSNYVASNGVEVHEVGFGFGFDGYCHYDLIAKKWKIESCDD